MKGSFGNNALKFEVLLALLAIGHSSFVVKPADAEVKVGDSTFLNCSISDASGEIEWYHFSVEQEISFQKYVYFKGHLMDPYDKRFKLDRSTSGGSFDLLITLTELQDAGAYVCHDVERDKSAIAQLTVLESKPICKSNIDSTGFVGPNDCKINPDKIQMSCGISYRGNVPPQLEWIRKKQGETFSVTDSLNCLNSNPTGRLYCNYNVYSEIDLDGSYYICKTQNSRQEQYSCEMDVIKIHYAVGDKDPVVKIVGDTVECTIKTNSPVCYYKWTSFEDTDKTVSENKSLRIINYGRLQCMAKCYIKDVECVLSVSVFASYAEDSAPIDWRAWIGGATLITFLILILVFFSVVICKPKYEVVDGSAEERIPLETFSSVDETENFCPESISFRNEFERIRTIATGIENEISGIAVLNGKLYVVYECQSMIEVYDCVTSQFEHCLDFEQCLNLTNPLDITSSESSKCLYFADLPNTNSKCLIKRLDVARKTINYWPIDGSECRISEFASNVIVCSTTDNRITEYSPRGDVVFEVKLTSNDGFGTLWSCVKVAGSKYAVSHIASSNSEHRISILDKESSGQVTRTYETTTKTCIMNIPICLLPYGPGRILVADKLNKRVLLINTMGDSCDLQVRDGRLTNLENQCKLEHNPIRMCFDEHSKKFFLATAETDLKAGVICTFVKRDAKESGFPEQNTSLKRRRMLFTKKLEPAGEYKTKGKSKISGFTLLNKMFYVAHENCSIIEVYTSKGFELKKRFDLKGLRNPKDLASSESNKCLYVVDLLVDKLQSKIQMVDVTGEVLKDWLTEDDMLRLSVYESNVIVCMVNKRLIQEFTLKGDTVSKICPSPSNGFGRLMHAIKVEESVYAVSHAVPRSNEHRISIIKSNENDELIVLFSTSPDICGLNEPIYLLLDARDRILVADYFNDRVLLINSTSKTCEVLVHNGRLKNLASHCTIEHHPARLYVDEARRKLYVALCCSKLKTGLISSFNMKNATLE